MDNDLQRANEWLITGRSAAFDDRHMAAICDLLAALVTANIAVAKRLDQVVEQLSSIAVTDSYPPDAAEQAARDEFDASLDR